MKVNIVYFKSQVRGLGLEATRPTMNHDTRQGYRFSEADGSPYAGGTWLFITRDGRPGRLAVPESNIAALDVDVAEEPAEAEEAKPRAKRSA